jgi:NAD(P)-dependent dehydrogenase (short-subunit alcohol dehydrogenase family)
MPEQTEVLPICPYFLDHLVCSLSFRGSLRLFLFPLAEMLYCSMCPSPAMVGSKDLEPSTLSFGKVFYNNQFKAKPVWPAPGTSLAGKTAVVTGAHTGLGYEAALELLGVHLSRLIIAVRSIDKGRDAAAKMQQSYRNAAIDVWQLDMNSYDSVQAFARCCDTELTRLDIDLLNAGIIKMSFTLNQATGHEESLQVNYLSTVLLGVLLLPILRAKRQPGNGPGCLTIVSAALTLDAKFTEREHDPVLAAFNDPKLFTSDETYNSTKLLAHCFLWNLVEDVSADDGVVNIADPAWCKGTDLTREVSGMGMKVGLKIFGATTGRTPKVGASCFVDAIVNKGKESHGCFLMSWKTHPHVCFDFSVCQVLILTIRISAGSPPAHTHPRAGRSLRRRSGRRPSTLSALPTSMLSLNP